MKHEGGNWCTTLSRAHYLLCVFMDKLTLADALAGIWPQSSPSLTQTGLFSCSPPPSLPHSRTFALSCHQSQL